MIKIITLLLSVVSLGLCQTPGTITTATSSTVTATAGNIVCVMSSTKPTSPLGVQITCKVGGSIVLSQTSTISPGLAGVAGQFSESGDSITWVLNQPVGQPIKWQMAANGFQMSDVF